MNQNKFYPLSVALATGAVLTSLAGSDTPFHFEALSSAVSGVDFDTVEADDIQEDACCGDHDKALLSFISYLGVQDKDIEDMVIGDDRLSSDLVGGLANAYAEKYSEDDTYALAEDFSNKFDEDGVEMDGISPPRCKSGYKRKMVIKHGKPDWKCIRLFGRAKMTAKQKQALRKARLKAHTALAEYSRKRSTSVGKKRGIYK